MSGNLLAAQRQDDLGPRHQDARRRRHHRGGIEDVGRVAAFLASEAGSSLTGSVVHADGGFHTIA